jgi:hypothetical protein
MCIHCGDGEIPQLVRSEQKIKLTNIGIPYNKFYFNCMKCDLTICNSCLSSHPRSHREFLKKAIDKARGRDDLPEEKDCAVCMQMVDIRIQCNDCELAVCYNCWVEPAGQSKFAEHEHRGLTFFRIPDDYGLDYYELECLSCQSGASFFHCGRCFEGTSATTFYLLRLCVNKCPRDQRRGGLIRVSDLHEEICRCHTSSLLEMPSNRCHRPRFNAYIYFHFVQRSGRSR